MLDLRRDRHLLLHCEPQLVNVIRRCRNIDFDDLVSFLILPLAACSSEILYGGRAFRSPRYGNRH